MHLVRTYNISPTKIRTIYGGVDDIFFTEHRASDKTDKEILFCGRLTSEKGVDLLLRVMPIILMEHRDVRLTIIKNY